MQLLSFDRSNLPQAALVALASVAAAALLGFVLAYWGWVWFAPRPEPRAPVVAEPGSGAPAASLFGIAQKEQGGASPGSSTIKLLGVVAAAPGRRGYAVVQLESREILAVLEGEEISSGLRLAEVAADHVVVERGGTRQTVTWPDKSVAVPAAPMRPTR
jgi:general secretion pathway protein C